MEDDDFAPPQSQKSGSHKLESPQVCMQHVVCKIALVSHGMCEQAKKKLEQAAGDESAVKKPANIWSGGK